MTQLQKNAKMQIMQKTQKNYTNEEFFYKIIKLETEILTFRALTFEPIN